MHQLGSKYQHPIPCQTNKFGAQAHSTTRQGLFLGIILMNSFMVIINVGLLCRGSILGHPFMASIIQGILLRYPFWVIINFGVSLKGVFCRHTIRVISTLINQSSSLGINLWSVKERASFNLGYCVYGINHIYNTVINLGQHFYRVLCPHSLCQGILFQASHTRGLLSITLHNSMQLDLFGCVYSVRE